MFQISDTHHMKWILWIRRFLFVSSSAKKRYHVTWNHVTSYSHQCSDTASTDRRAFDARLDTTFREGRPETWACYHPPQRLKHKKKKTTTITTITCDTLISAWINQICWKEHLIKSFATLIWLKEVITVLNNDVWYWWNDRGDISYGFAPDVSDTPLSLCSWSDK